MRILLVDDERLVACLYARAVEMAGYTVEVIHNSEEAFERALAAPPALLLTDQQMPGLTGLVLAARLREARAASFPMILMSADDDVGLVRAGLAAGIDDFLVKGTPFECLAERLRWWTQGPFRGQPAHVRAAALEALAQGPVLDTPIAKLHAPLDATIDEAVRQVSARLAAVTNDDGATPTETLQLAGLIDGTLAVLAAAAVLLHLRRAEAMTAVADRLGSPHAARLHALWPDIDRHVANTAFQQASRELISM